jgi:hypothetical protein
MPSSRTPRPKRRRSGFIVKARHPSGAQLDLSARGLVSVVLAVSLPAAAIVALVLAMIR